MASRPKRPCPKCHRIWDGKRCACGHAKTHGWGNDRRRGNRHQRGYDKAWEVARAECIRRKSLEAAMAGVAMVPICEECGEAIEGEVHVDHREPFSGPSDPKRLDQANLRCLHPRCHMRKTGRQARGGAK
jgi:5-methylcytosine-specific restriction endonuclease McrA